MRKLALALGALLLTAVACGGGGGGGNKDDNGEYGSPLLSDTTVSVAPRATTTVTVARNDDGGGRTATTRRTTTTKAGVDPALQIGQDCLAGDASCRVGHLAPFLLRPSLTDKIIYELMLQEGLDVQPGTLTHITNELRRYSNNKTVEVQRTQLPPGVSDWPIQDLHDYANRYTRFKPAAKTAILHVLFVHGGLKGGAGVLGVASRGDVLSMFPDRYKSGSISPAVVEDVVVMHETGHILGLVDEWLTTGRGDFRDDPAPGGHHSTNKKSVMYFAADTSGIFSLFSGGPPREFDDNDRKDLFVIRDGAAEGSKGT